MKIQEVVVNWSKTLDWKYWPFYAKSRRKERRMIGKRTEHPHRRANSQQTNKAKIRLPVMELNRQQRQILILIQSKRLLGNFGPSNWCLLLLTIFINSPQLPSGEGCKEYLCSNSAKFFLSFTSALPISVSPLLLCNVSPITISHVSLDLPIISFLKSLPLQ